MSIEEALNLPYEETFTAIGNNEISDLEISVGTNGDTILDDVPIINEPLSEEDILNDGPVLYTDEDVRNGVVVEPVQIKWSDLPSEAQYDVTDPSAEAINTTLHLCQHCNGFFSTDKDLIAHSCPSRPPNTDITVNPLEIKTPLRRSIYRPLRKPRNMKFEYKKEAKEELSVRTRNDHGPHICHVCNKSLSRRSSLMIHMRRHTGEMPFGCDYCKKKFVVLYDLDRHMLTHVGEKKYSCYCDICRKPFVSRSGMLEHKRIHHIGHTMVSCDVCGTKFTDDVKLHAHKATHESENTMDTNPANIQVLVLYDNLT